MGRVPGMQAWMPYPELLTGLTGQIRSGELRTAEQQRVGRNEHEFLFEDVFETVESAPAAPGMS